MFGKKTSQYMIWSDHAAVLKSMPYGCQVVNTGSTPSFKAFDYSLWSVKGFNLGFQPQPLYYDFETLKKYSEHVAKGAKILIGVEAFKFFVDAYADEKTDHKYYLWLDKEQIRTYDRKKFFLINYAPVVLHSRFVLHDVKHGVKKLLDNRKNKAINNKLDSEKADIEWSQKFLRGWNRQFGWENGQVVREAQRQNIAVNENRLTEMIEYCFVHGWEPYLVVSPFSPNLSKLLSPVVLQEGLWEPLERVSKGKDVKILNYFYDNRFANYELYENALILNADGRKLFNISIQEDIKSEETLTMEIKKTYKLRNGVELPWISFGTGVIRKYTRNIPLFLKSNLLNWLRSIKHRKMNRELYGNIHIKSVLEDSYDAGFRMYDSGRIYAHSEDCIGKTVSKYPDVIITTKCSAMDVIRKASPNDVAGNLGVSLENLNRDCADLYMLHWPEGDWLDYYRQIIEEYKKGRCRAFGACNMEIEHLKAIEDAGLELPMVMQTEMHPLCTRKEILNYCKAHGIQVMAHTPIGSNIREIRESPIILKLAKKYQKNPSQIVIRWHYQNDVIPVVSTFNKKHMQENLDIFDFELTAEEMAEINGMNQNHVLLNSHGIDDPNYIYNY